MWSVRPEAMRSSVDLPQPDGPTTVTNSPAPTENEMPDSAWVPSGNTMLTSSKLNVVAASAWRRRGDGRTAHGDLGDARRPVLSRV